MKTEKAPFTPSWELTGQSLKLIQQHITPVMYLVLIPSLLVTLGLLWSGISDGNAAPDPSNLSIAGSLIALIGLAWTLINTGPITVFELAVARGKSMSMRQAYKVGLRYNFKLYLYYILYVLAVVLGLILFIVPGLIMLRRYMLAGYYLVDSDISVLDAMKLSASESAPYSGWLWGVFGVQITCNLISYGLQGFGPIGLVLGQLIVLVTLFLTALRYIEIRRATQLA